METKTVLVIEDNPLNLKLFRTLLRLGHYHVLEAGDAETGLKILQNHRPNLIIMDIQLPGMDGLTATGIIKSNPEIKNIPVVAMTAYAMEGDAQRALDGGCDGYMSKPIETKTFLDSIGKFMEGYATGTPPPGRTAPPGHRRSRETVPASPFPGITDDLTGLYNQAYFHRLLDMEIKRTHYRHYQIGLVIIVLDDFKAVQAAAGRPAADRLLHETGRIITNNIREVDRATRYEHQYFAVMLPYADRQGISVVIERLRRAFSGCSFPGQPFRSGGIAVRFGVSCYPDDGETTDELIQKACSMVSGETKEEVL
jgi:diguanylate cyclase (GGDEF)-like protein